MEAEKKYVSLLESSRKSWSVVQTNSSGWPGDMNFQSSCLQRIANSLEALAVNSNKLLNELNCYKSHCEKQTSEIKRLQRKNRQLDKEVKRLV
jgi:hypothetical protein